MLLQGTQGLNTYYGIRAGENSTIGSSNTFIGAVAGSNNDTGYQNTFVGTDAGRPNEGGNNGHGDVVSMLIHLRFKRLQNRFCSCNQISISRSLLHCPADCGTANVQSTGHLASGNRQLPSRNSGQPVRGPLRSRDALWDPTIPFRLPYHLSSTET